jgi:hypothetical protein
MALTRKMLKAMSIEDEKIDQIIEAHTETVEALKEERDSYKADAEKLPSVKKELDKLKDEAAKDGDKNPYKVKYEAIKEEFEAYKHDVSKKETKVKKEDAVKAILQEIGVADKRINAVIKVTDLESIELDENGKIKDADSLKNSLKEEWGDFIVSKKEAGATTSTPPANAGGKLTKEQIMAEKDTAKRQQLMLENKELFGI